jgi:hypothetical protein
MDCLKLVFYCTVLLALALKYDAKILFYSVPDPRHLSPMQIIAETYSEIHKDTELLFLFYNGSLFNYTDNKYSFLESYPTQNSSINFWMNYVPGIKNIFGRIHSQYTLVDSVIRSKCSVR